MCRFTNILNSPRHQQINKQTNRNYDKMYKCVDKLQYGIMRPKTIAGLEGEQRTVEEKVNVCLCAPMNMTYIFAMKSNRTTATLLDTRGVCVSARASACWFLACKRAIQHSMSAMCALFSLHSTTECILSFVGCFNFGFSFNFTEESQKSFDMKITQINYNFEWKFTHRKQNGIDETWKREEPKSCTV